MDMATFIDYYRKGYPVPCDDAEFNELLAQCTSEAQEITMELNSKYHSQEEITALFSKLTGQTMDPGFACNPPFYSNFGKNITIGKNVFFNMGCTFQDRGGVYIGDGTLLGMNVTIATLNHGLDPNERNTTIASPVHVGENVWIGASATILPGVTIGKNAVVGAGAVVTKDVAENTVVAGVPAKAVKQV